MSAITKQVKQPDFELSATWNGRANPEVVYRDTATGEIHIERFDLASSKARDRFVEALGEGVNADAAGEALKALQLETPRTSGAPAPSGQGQALVRETDEPWPEPVDGAALLDGVAGFVLRFVSMPAAQADMLALWIVGAHATEAAYHFPYLAITAPEKQCGKSTCLTVVGRLCPRPIMASNVTPSALFRTIETIEPTLLLDEVETFLRSDNEELRGILNAGHNRDTAYVIRNVGEDHTPAKFATFCPKAMTCIGDLPGTIADRALPLQLQRRARTAAGEKWRPQMQPAVAALADRLRREATRWASDNLDTLRDAAPASPEALTEREADNWHLLFSIADAAGGTWPGRAREAASLLANPDDGRQSTAVELLVDIRAWFESHPDDAEIEGKDLVEHLLTLDGRPWPEWRQGRPISQTGVARLLRPFGIKSGKMHHIRGPRGYARAGFADPFERYLTPLHRPEPECSTCDFPRVEQPTADAATDYGVCSTSNAKIGGSRGGEKVKESEGQQCPNAGCSATTEKTRRGMFRCRTCSPSAFAPAGSVS